VNSVVLAAKITTEYTEKHGEGTEQERESVIERVALLTVTNVNSTESFSILSRKS